MVDNCAIEKKFLPDVPWLISVGDVQYGMLSKGNPCNRYSAQSRAVFPRSYCTISAPVRTAPMRPCLSTWWQQNWEANLSRWETAEIEAWYGHCVIPCNLKRPKTLHACRRSLGEDVAKNTFHLRKIVGFLFTSFFLCWFVWVFVLCFCSLFVYDVAFYCFCPSLTEVNRTIRDFQNHSLHADVYAKSLIAILRTAFTVVSIFDTVNASSLSSQANITNKNWTLNKSSRQPSAQECSFSSQHHIYEPISVVKALWKNICVVYSPVSTNIQFKVFLILFGRSPRVLMVDVFLVLRWTLEEPLGSFCR